MEITTIQSYELLFIEHCHRIGSLAKTIIDKHTFRTALTMELGLTEVKTVALPIFSIRINKIPSIYLFIVKPTNPFLMSKVDKSVEIQFPDIIFSMS